MVEHRTRLQREANQLDMDMFRMIGRLEDFATETPGVQVAPIDNAASALRSARHLVRSKMHPKDVERSNG